MTTVYTYRNCSTCRKAIAWLREKGIDFEEKPIRETPPAKEELRRALAAYDGETRRLFNTSGQDYRSLDLKDRIQKMNTEETIELLSKNGNLVKRPFVVHGSSGLAGFRSDEWEQLLL